MLHLVEIFATNPDIKSQRYLTRGEAPDILSLIDMIVTAQPLPVFHGQTGKPNGVIAFGDVLRVRVHEEAGRAPKIDYLITPPVFDGDAYADDAGANAQGTDEREAA